jgi:predicted RecA/RadA family phage recombinase
MAFKGQPVPSTLTNVQRAKISDGKSVRVIVPQSTVVVGEQLILMGGFLGVAKQSVTTAAGVTAEVILDIAQEEFETDQITTTQAFAAGTAVYWDDTNKKLTETAASNRLAGRVTVGKDANNVIWFILGPQV